ncbi:PREDICTED: probable carboxylesterase 2 [Nelumbo nucifera]|uniref:Alpha/beta hydrolase fold-3 domain-containing protein n=2 Tax=Nelumbo nucifera TaxID=4432 RepID=A0A822Z828_NELNU|nr:PREDICTED: probable carboxylesterase 2 [Nelumbo nucifera]DAD41222.1 TPA_asm: hypothetical protein HUJ06_015545 [Nelumbo nucifera]
MKNTLHVSHRCTSSNGEIAHDFFPLIREYKDGRVERFKDHDFVPPSLDPCSGVSSKDVVIAPETGISARLYLPSTTYYPHRKIPLLAYLHGGAFCIESAFSSTYHRFVSSLVAEAHVVHPLPTAYDDCFEALKWVASHSKGDGPEAWLNDHVDFDRVFLAGDSAGANLAHYVAMRVGESRVDGLNKNKLIGLVLIHPYFEVKEPLGPEASDEEKKAKVGKLWQYLCPSIIGCNDPKINPAADPKISGLGCRQVGIWVAEKDFLREKGGLLYYEVVKKSGWGGVAEVIEEEGEDHVFHLVKPDSEKAVAMTKRLAAFLNHHYQDKV